MNIEKYSEYFPRRRSKRHITPKRFGADFESSKPQINSIPLPSIPNSLTSQWTIEEIINFFNAYVQYSTNFNAITNFVNKDSETKSISSVIALYSKFRKYLSLPSNAISLDVFINLVRNSNVLYNNNTNSTQSHINDNISADNVNSLEILSELANTINNNKEPIVNNEVTDADNKNDNDKKNIENYILERIKFYGLTTLSHNTNFSGAEKNLEQSQEQKPFISFANSLTNPKFRKFLFYEFFYSFLDNLYFSVNEFSECLSCFSISKKSFTRFEWKVIRSIMGRTRRLSNRFLSEEREKFHKYKKYYHHFYSKLISSLPNNQNAIAFFPSQLQFSHCSILSNHIYPENRVIVSFQGENQTRRIINMERIMLIDYDLTEYYYIFHHLSLMSNVLLLMDRKDLLLNSLDKIMEIIEKNSIEINSDSYINTNITWILDQIRNVNQDLDYYFNRLKFKMSTSNDIYKNFPQSLNDVYSEFAEKAKNIVTNINRSFKVNVRNSEAYELIIVCVTILLMLRFYALKGENLFNLRSLLNYLLPKSNTNVALFQNIFNIFSLFETIISNKTPIQTDQS